MHNVINIARQPETSSPDRCNATLLGNVGYLYVLQGVNYLVPLVTVPYILRTLGLEQFGLLCFAYAFTNYFVVVANYGFQLSGTRMVSLNRHDLGAVSKLFWSILFIKLALALVSAVLCSAVVLVLPALRPHWPLFMISFVAVLGNVIFPNWYFLGLERIKVLTTISAGARLLYVLALIAGVRTRQDLFVAAFLQSSVDVVAAGLTVIVLWRGREITWRAPSIADCVDIVRDGWTVFQSQLYVTLLTSTNTFILGLFAPKEAVGIYAAAEKIIRAVIGLSTPIVNGIYPRIALLFQGMREVALIRLRTLLYGGIGVFLLIALAMIVAADPLVRLVTGTFYPEISLLVRLMAPIPLIIFIYNMYGMQILLNLPNKEHFARAFLYSGISAVVASIIWVPLYQEVATALIFVLAESLAAVLIVRAAHAAGFNLFALATDNGTNMHFDDVTARLVNTG